MNPNDPNQPTNNPNIAKPTDPLAPPPASQVPQGIYAVPQNQTPQEPQVFTPSQSSDVPQQPSSPAPTDMPQPTNGMPSQSSSPTPIAYTAPSVSADAPNPGAKKSRKKLAVALTVVGAAAVLLGGAAAAYVGLIVPNKPENVLSQALKNTLLEKNFTTDGALELQAADNSKDDAMPAMKAVFKSKSSVSDKTSALDMKLTASGVEIPVEARYIDKNLYFKVGDLSTLKPIVRPYAAVFMGGDSGVADKMVDDVAQLVSNQWVLVDSTVLDSSDITCAVDSLSLTEQDIQLLQDAYSKNPFATIKNHADDTVSGKSAIKYELAIDDNKTAKYIDGLPVDNLSFMKALSKCGDMAKSDKLNTSELADDDITPLKVWVDKANKRIVKIAGESTVKDAQNSNTKGSFEATISYGTVSVDKPANAKPVLQLFDELQTLIPVQDYTSGFSGFDDSSSI